MAKSSKTLGFLRGNRSECTKQVKSAAQTSLVIPTPEYCSAVWDPSSLEDTHKLEKAQRQAAHFVHNSYFDMTPERIFEMVSGFGNLYSSKRRQFYRLSTLYKIQRGLLDTQTLVILYGLIPSAPEDSNGSTKQLSQ